MSKRLPISRATNEHRSLLARIGASEQAIADAGADLASAGTVGRLMSTMPRDLGASASELHGFDDDPFPVEYVWMARWAACKHVYRIDPTVADELARQPLEGALPADALRQLPYPIVYVDAPVDFSVGAASGARPERASGFLAYLDHAPEAPEADCLSLVYLHKEPDEFGKRRHIVQLDLSFPTLEDCVNEVVEADGEYWRGLDLGSEAEALLRFRKSAEAEVFCRCTAQALNLLLYIVSAERDSEVVYAPPRGGRGQRPGQRTNPETVEVVGAAMGRAIGEARRRAACESAATPPKAGRTIAPHIRRAHFIGKAA